MVDPDLAAESLVLGESPLTGRERDVLLATADGGTVGQIASRLFLSEGTVRNHLSSVIGKTGAATRADALRIANERAGSERASRPVPVQAADRAGPRTAPRPRGSSTRS